MKRYVMYRPVPVGDDDVWYPQAVDIRGLTVDDGREMSDTGLVDETGMTIWRVREKAGFLD